MAMDIKLWRIQRNKEINLKEIPSKNLSETGILEENLREWILSNPSIISDEIIIIGKEIESIDILGINKNSKKVVIIETKREDPREVISQIIDYASFVAEKDREWLEEKIKEKNAEDKIKLSELKEVDLEDLEMYIVATKPNEKVERMIRFLSKYELDINLVIIRYHKDENGEEFITRTYFLTEETKEELSKSRKRESYKWSEEEYLERIYEDYGEESHNKIKTLIKKIKESPNLYFGLGTGKSPHLIIYSKETEEALVYVTPLENKIFLNVVSQENLIKIIKNKNMNKFLETLESLNFKKQSKGGAPYFRRHINELTPEEIEKFVDALNYLLS